MSHTYEFMSMTTSICYSIAYIFIAFGVCHAGWAYYTKVQNDKRITLYNRIFNIYREYNDVISSYTHLINKNENLDLNIPEYKEAQVKLYDNSRACMLVADDNLHIKISRFIEQYFNLSTNTEINKNTDETKTEYLAQLLDIQKAMREHLESIRFYK